MTHTGKFIVIEGTDGSGKGTHTKLLAGWLREQHQQLETFEFPRYDEPSAYFVKQYLVERAYGTADEVSPYKGSLFYALDRFDASFKIRDALFAGTNVLADRYVGSNMGHQGAKLATMWERKEYFEWNDHLEYGILGIPRPDLNIVLHMPSEQAQLFVDQKSSRQHMHGQTRDLHEDDLGHLRKAERTYLELCSTFPDHFTLIECQAEDGTIRSIDDIQQQIRKLAQPPFSS